MSVLGYGIAAFGAGPLQNAGVELSSLYGATAIVALVTSALAFVLAPRGRQPASLHPRPASHQRSGANA